MGHGSLCCTELIRHESTTQRFSSPIRAFPRLSFIFLLTTPFFIVTTAQTPIPVSAMAYATIDEKTLYIQGGSTNIAVGSSINQFFALDLTQSSLDISKPPWKALTLGSGTQVAPSDSSYSMTVSKDKQSLVVWGHQTGISVYNITSGSWNTPSSLPSNSTTQVGGLAAFGAVTDPGTGLIYIPSGANVGQNMMEYNPSTGISQVLPMPAQISRYGFACYGIVWSTQRSSILLYGGLPSFGNATNPNLWEYVPTTSSWSLLTTTGQSPGDVGRHCMVPAYNGSKMVLFGGTTSSLQPLGSIYILDVQSLSWTKGTDIQPSLHRESMACTAAGDNFVAWGGDLDYEQSKSFGTPVIYNLKTNQWTTSATTSIGAIIGGAVAGVVVLVVIGFFGYRRYRSKKLRDSSLISTAVAMENIGDPNNIQPVIIVRPDALPPLEQPPVNEQVHAPILLGQPPQAILPSETDKYPKYKIEFVTPNDGNVNEEPLSNIISRNPQDRGEIAPTLPLVARNPHVWQQYDVRPDPNAQLEAQIAQIQAQHNLLYQQQEETLRLQQQRLETLRLEQQAQMEMLRRQLIANKKDSNDG